MSVRKLLFAFISLLILFLGVKSETVYAETSSYHSAGWIGTEGNIPYSTTGCQASNDGSYCSRPSGTSVGLLYFGSFGSLEDFGIPINSTIDKLRIRIKGKSSGAHSIGVTVGYNKKPFTSVCQKSSDSFRFYLGPIDNTVEKEFVITSSNGLANCITTNNIDFRNLTFAIGNYLSFVWNADIDNFEIAFDYTPPSVVPTPAVFHEKQKGRVWKVKSDKSELEQVEGLDSVVYVAAGGSLNAALKSDGTVWTWVNENNPVQLKDENGEGHMTDVKKISVGKNYGMMLKNDGSVWEWIQIEEEAQNPVHVKYAGVNLSNAIDIAAGRAHRLVLKSDGSVLGWGSNTDGQVGIGCTGGNCSTINNPRLINNFTNVASIAAGENHSLAVKDDGSVWGWGSQSLGQLGEGNQDSNGNYSDRTFPVQLNGLNTIQAVSAKGNYNLAINSSGELLEWGWRFERRNPRVVQGLSSISNVSAGPSSYSFGVLGHVIKEDGTLWQLYINDIPPKQVPILKDVVAVASGDGTPTLAVINSSGEVLGESTGPKPFLDLPWDYGEGNFEKQVFNPESWFDHMYPLQNITCCTNKVRTYLGDEDKDVAYRSHAGYDYASRNGVEYRTPVLAAAPGSAEFKPASKTGGLGNLIKIDHMNGYQTWYGHLDTQGLIVSSEGTTKEVAKGNKIGETGFTGNIYPPNQFGAHIHFAVIKDINKNGNFNDDYPYGLVDPLGWDGEEKDPWTEYGGEVKGADSVNLFTNFPKPKQQAISKSAGGELNHKNVQVKFDPDTLPLDFTVRYKDGPYEMFSDQGKQLQSITPSFFLEAFNTLGDKLTKFIKPVYIIYKYHDQDLANTKEESLLIYYYNIATLRWEPLPSSVDLEDNIIITESDHFTQFAVMGEVKDSDHPVTQAKLEGASGQEMWYSSSVDLLLIAEDNEGGSGVKDTLFSVNNSEWQKYSDKVAIIEEGNHEVLFQSSDNVGNIEEVKRTNFNIDKTPPVTAAQVAGIEGESGWYTSDVKVKLNAEDSASGVAKTEYSLDDGETYLSYNSEINIDKEGRSEILYRSVDKAGNREDVKKLPVKIDKTVPNSVVYTTGLRGEENWYRSNVSVALNGNDSISGYKASFYSKDGENYIEYIGPIIFESEGNFTISYYSIDNAGNREETKTTLIRIDKTDPVIMISASPNKLWPANGKMVDVRVNGNIDEENLLEAQYKVTDEYGLVQPILTDFNQILELEARRNGNDRDGRLYLIKAIVEDFAGNSSSAEVKVIVPHDQRK